MKLKRDVVMLPTNDKSKLVLSYNNKLGINHTYDLTKFDDATYQHFYITSDEKPVNDDWCIQNGNYLCKITCNQDRTQQGLKKIIATTDKSLGLPSPSDGFIKKFIERYNAGNPITEVMVEYEEYPITTYGMSDGEPETDTRLKVDKDNCITITAVKESWTREEVIAIHKANCERLTNAYISSDIEWIEQNL